MAYYLVQASYTNESWAMQTSNPRSPIDRLTPVVEGLGGTIESLYYTFGEYDIVAIIQYPDNQSAAAFSLAASAGGAVKAIKTTPLMTVEEGLGAVRKAGSAGYRPPGG